jgi:hypothetical protein
MVKVTFLKKTNTKNGNPRYEIFVDGASGKITGLRKLKQPGTYSFESYNKESYLKNYVFKNKKVVIR